MNDAMKALQVESGVSLNTVANMETFISDIHSGRWDLVLSQVSSLQLPREKLVNLYEQVVIELLEAREVDLARELLRTTEPMRYMKVEQPDRYMKLEHLCQRPVFVDSDAYEMGITKERRRHEIADALSSEVSVVPPSRLLSLLGQALRFQQAQGLIPKDGTMDLFRGGRRSTRKDQEEKMPRRQAGHIKFSPDSHPETTIFSPDGTSLVTGSVDGFVEVWDADTCRLRKDLEYQEKDELMMHEEEPILCSTFNRDGELLATGSRDGKVKVWRLSTGACLRKFNRAHSQGVTALCFAKDSSQLLTGSFDCLARIHGLKSGKTLKEFRGHTSFVNSVIYTKDGSNALSASSDGSIRLWDVRTTECLLNFRPGLSAGSLAREIAVHTIQLMPTNPDHILVCVKGPQAFVMTTQGQVVKTFSSGKASGGDFTCATTSPQGKWVYCMGEDGVMYMFDTQTGQLENVLEAADREVIGIAHHPHRNLVATITDNGELKLWKP
eukprot:CAMPEP_0185035328 /NCGR_PEP_ID=MMETSP1103-20130426/26523_1 /TAXON_ID=36769 /ORGANISM="Paraphysomonas bandaiensis, Strain Caron Lab Isolate" /LENGTH=495 /DNA_ID=CAMNT_0027572357 /DNA_START=80 /DNA_END=1570 /DNA_ORIENTATION=+